MNNRTKKVILVRHGALAAAFDGRYVGHQDVPISSSGLERAHRLAQHLKLYAIDDLWCSPALRARQTATPIAQVLGLSYRIITELNEIDFGRWDGLTFEQICAMDQPLVDEWAKLADDFCFPGGESHRHFQQRVATICVQIRNSQQRHIALVTHGGVIRSLLCQLLDLPPMAYLKFTINRGAYATVEIQNQYAQLTGLYNDISIF